MDNRALNGKAKAHTRRPNWFSQSNSSYSEPQKVDSRNMNWNCQGLFFHYAPLLYRFLFCCIKQEQYLHDHNRHADCFCWWWSMHHREISILLYEHVLPLCISKLYNNERIYTKLFPFAALCSFIEGPPFTLQRLCEVIILFHDKHQVCSFQKLKKPWTTMSDCVFAFHWLFSSLTCTVKHYQIHQACVFERFRFEICVYVFNGWHAGYN